MNLHDRLLRALLKALSSVPASEKKSLRELRSLVNELEGREEPAEIEEEAPIVLQNLPEDLVGEFLQQAEGARALLLEIIRRAAYDWVLYRSSSRIDQKQLAEDAYIWLFVEDQNHPHWLIRVREGKQMTALLAICQELDLEVDIVRKHVRALTPHKVMSSGRPPENSRSSDYSVRVAVHADVPGDDDISLDFEGLLVTGFELE